MPSAECCRMPFGLGAFAGPPLVAGHVADRIGFGRALRLAFLVQAAAVALPAIAAGSSALAISSLVVGAMVPGIGPWSSGACTSWCRRMPSRDSGPGAWPPSPRRWPGGPCLRLLLSVRTNRRRLWRAAVGVDDRPADGGARLRLARSEIRPLTLPPSSRLVADLGQRWSNPNICERHIVVCLFTLHSIWLPRCILFKYCSRGDDQGSHEDVPHPPASFA